jgi:hypothetical protein
MENESISYSFPNFKGHFLPLISFRPSVILLALFLTSSTVLNAQNFYSYPSNPEYGQIAINQYKVADGAQYSTSDPTAVMTMDCLAANGYGQWTVSTNLGSKVKITSPTAHPWIFSPNQTEVNVAESWNPNGSAAWLLLGNLIALPSEQFVTSDATHPGCQPPGVVSGGTFNQISSTDFPTTFCKVAANLNGSVRYVTVEPGTNRWSFWIEGLNDERGASGDQQIHNELNNSSTLLPNPPITRQIVRDPIHTYTAAQTFSVTNNGVDASEADYRDEFDIAMDKKWLYIVWWATNSGVKEVWATAVQLSNGNVAFGFPIKIGTGIRPTVACNVRSNPANPNFHVAYIDDATNSIVLKEYSGTIVTLGHSEILPKTFEDPFLLTSGSPTHDSYSTLSHARVVVSSTPTGTAVACVYALVSPTGFSVTGCQHDLIVYQPIHWSLTTDIAEYIEGVCNSNAANFNQPILPSPMVNATDQVLGVNDKHIIAFANPYDNSSSGAYNQFHLVYQPRYQRISATYNPLIIVRGFDDGLPNASTTDSRLLLTRDASGLMTSTVSKWVAAANQMGIHIHWRDGSDHYYVRDTRAFDEDIEEHTLITNSCMIADGSGHGGTSSGALLKSGVKMTLWSDPNYGAVNGGSTTKGMYWQFPDHIYQDYIYLNQENIGTLSYNSTGLDLTVGNSSGTAPASLFTMPVCNIAKLGSPGSITINPNSVWEYYGTSVPPVYGDWSSMNWAYSNMTINLNGPSSGPTSPNLKIHEGATFWACNSLHADHARIDILYGNNINPINTVPNTTSQVSGLLRIRNTAVFENSEVNSFLPYSTWVDQAPSPAGNWTNVVMYISGFSTGNPSIYTLHSTNTNYTNFASTSSMSSSGGGVAFIFYEGYPADEGVPDKVEFEGGNFTRTCFHAYNPSAGGLEIKDMHIKDIDGYAIRINRALTAVPFFDYADVLVSGNIFENILNHGSSGVHFDPLFGIVLQNFNKAGSEAEVNVLNNDFTSTINNSLTENYFNEAAIYFNNSTGNIIGNQITERPFSWYDGIRTTDGGLSLVNYPYICDNTIKKAGERGIFCQHFQGIISHCQFDDCGLSIGCNSVSCPLITSTISNSNINALSIVGGTIPSVVDLTGIHTISGDYAAFNTISGTSGTAPNRTIFLVNDGNQTLKLGDWSSGTWTVFASNNIVLGSSTKHVLCPFSPSLSLNNVDNNYWGGGDLLVGTGISFSPNPSAFSVSPSSGSSWACDAYASNRSKGGSMSILKEAQDIDTCAYLKRWDGITTFNAEQAKMKYDTLRMFIEQCAASDNESWRVFSSIDGAVQRYSVDTNRYDLYRAWLISVLYLNTTNPQYFCRVMGSISGTFQSGKYFVLGKFAVLNYLREYHPECWNQSSEDTYKQDSIQLTLEGFDLTHLPPLDSLGLGFLLKSSSPSPTAVAFNFLASFTSSPNPFKNETHLRFHLNRMAYTTIGIYDVLGHQVWGDGKGRSLEAGDHEVVVDGSLLPEGSLYARIETGFGEVRTVKLIKVSKP